MPIVKKITKDKKGDGEEEKGGETPIAGNKIKTALEKGISDKIGKGVNKKSGTGGKDDDTDDPIA